MKVNQIKIFLLPIFLFTAFITLSAQEELKINSQKRCIFTSNVMDEELYRFPDNEKVATWIKEILQACGAEQNFEVVQTNVENVSAVLDGEKRYLLYSLDFVQKATGMEIYGALAHEIGHHINEHTFIEGRRKSEELEADYFMGFIFSKKGYFQLPINAFLSKMPSSYGILLDERRLVVYDGFKKSDKSMQVNSLPWDNDLSFNALSMPSFPWPPPSCNTRFEIPETTFAGLTKLGDVEKKIRNALNNTGYSQRSYFSVPNGFALVTQLEQYNASDGTTRNDITRWLDYPKKERFEGVMDYITSFVMPQKGYFRLFVFVVTNQAFGSSQQRISKTEATAWLNQGYNKLPKSVADAPFTEGGHDVTVLVYEFEVPESNRKAVQKCPSPVYDARTHLMKAGISQGFGF